jgi:superfamily II DNA/RNA helicase
MTYPEGLSLYFLEQYGIPREVLEAIAFEHGGDSTLLEIQQDGIKMGLCDSKKLLNSSGIISGPTGSGKTLLAELRMLTRYFDKGQCMEPGITMNHEKAKTIFLVPTKAMGLEKLRYFTHLYGRFGINVLYSDSDIRNDDGNILRGQFDVAIMVNEKLNYFEQHNPEFFKNVCEVVVDEFGIVSEKTRGPKLEVTITGLFLGFYKPVVLVLTTPLEIPKHLLRTMFGFLLETQKRPIDIRTGIWTRQNAEFQSWSCNTLQSYLTEKWDLGSPANNNKMLKELIIHYKKGIMFAVPSKALAISCADQLSQLADRDQEVKQVISGPASFGQSIENRLIGLETTKNKMKLNELLKRGIGFHHADLTSEERREVETVFRNREICVLFCTSTLARGINLPANVIVFLGWGNSVTYGKQNYHSQSQFSNEFNNWMGRIGRPGFETSAQPSAIYLAQTSSETQYIKKLIFTKRTRLYPSLANTDVELTGQLLSACSSISNSYFLKAKSIQQSNMPYLFSLKDIREFFSLTPSAADEGLKHLILHRTTNCLLSLLKPHKRAIIDLRNLVYRVLHLYTTAKYQDVIINGGDTFKLICGLEYLSCTNMKTNSFSPDVIKEMIDSLKRSIFLTLRNGTLCELECIFRGTDIHRDISLTIAKIQGLDKHYLDRGLGDLRGLFKTDDYVGSVQGLNQRMDSIACQIDAIVNCEFENTPDKKHLSWLTRVKTCRLNRALLLKFESLLESDEFLETLLCSSADKTTSNKNLPRYLNWVKTGDKQGFELTKLGKICCSHGISTQTCDELYKWLSGGVENGKMLEIREVGFFLLLLGTADGSLVRLLKTDLSMACKDYILKEYSSDFPELPPCGGRDALITCLALKDWMTGLPTIQIEKKYGLCCGSLNEVARHVSRLIRACHDIAGKVQGVFGSKIQITVNLTDSIGKYQIPDDLGDLAEMVLHGLPSEALPITYLRVEGLTRDWTMNLIHALEEQGVGDVLPKIERLQLLSEEHLKGILPTRGLTKRLREALGKHGLLPLAKNLVNDREFILRFYLLPQVIKAQLGRGKPHYGEHRFTALRIITANGGHTILRRNGLSTGQPITIQNEKELINWVQHGAVDFYGEIGEMVPALTVEESGTSSKKASKYVIDRFFVDLDPRNGFPMDRLRAVTKNIYDFFTTTPQVEETKIYWTGGKGFHIIGFFKEGIQLDVEVAKDRLIELLKSWRICNDVDIFMEQDATILDPYLTLDLSPIMRRGIYRNELSLHAKSGGCCVEVKSDQVNNFDPDIEAKPEAVLNKLIRELTQDERNNYYEQVNQLITATADETCSLTIKT